METDLGITKEYLMNLIAEEKENLSAYEMSCAKYNIPTNQIATMVAKAKIQILQDLMRGRMQVSKVSQ